MFLGINHIQLFKRVFKSKFMAFTSYYDHIEITIKTAWMELESIMLNEISQAVRDKYYMISPLIGT